MRGKHPIPLLKSRERSIKTINLKGRIFFKDQIKHLNGQLLKEGKLKLNLYRNTDNFINLTGLKQFCQFRQISDKLQTIIHNPPIGFCVDCCFFSLKTSVNFNIKNLYLELKQNKTYFCSYEPELFPG